MNNKIFNIKNSTNNHLHKIKVCMKNNKINRLKTNLKKIIMKAYIQLNHKIYKIINSSSNLNIVTTINNKIQITKF